jgi:hypothetical protein
MLSNCSIISAKIIITMKKKRKKRGDFNISNFEEKKWKKVSFVSFCFATSQSFFKMGTTKCSKSFCKIKF